MNIAGTFVIFWFYIYWALIITCPIVLAVTIYVWLRKKGTIKQRRLLIIFSALLLILSIYQIAFSAYKKNLIEKMPEEEIYK
ncbi:MAG: hypothetical protein HOP07_01865 [Bacteriovoracaceae bacterium]|nr:hypothetical protein [Bacteriovoracaceae bacterium]